MRPALQIHFQLLASPEAAAVSRKTVQVTVVWEELATESLHGPLAKHERKCGKRHHGLAGDRRNVLATLYVESRWWNYGRVWGWCEAIA